MIYLLFFVLLILMMCSYFFSNRDVSSPSVLFSFSFVFMTFIASIYAEQLDLIEFDKVFWVVFGGVFEFCAVCWLIKFFSTKFKKKTTITDTSSEGNVKEIYVNNIIKLFVLLIEMLTAFASVFYIKKLTGISNYSEAVEAYRYAKLFTTDSGYNFPRWLGWIELFTKAMGYWFSYVLINNYLASKKIDIIALLDVVAFNIYSLTGGGRTETINLLCAILVMYLILKNKKTRKIDKIHFTSIIKFIIIICLLLLAFKSSATIFGRNVDEYYILKYCGAEIKNLEVYLNNPHNNFSSMWGSQTFFSIIRTIGPKFGMKNTFYNLDIPYVMYNGINLGNVYTTFYSFIYDFGYWGEVILVLLMAIISQVLYQKSYKKFNNELQPIFLLIYGYFSGTLVLSFFSNKFYERISLQFIYIVIIWIFAQIFFTKKYIFNKNS